MPSAEDDYRELIAFLYRAPIALVQTDLNGRIELMTPRAMALLAPLAPASSLHNLFEVFKRLAPDLLAAAMAHGVSAGMICEGLRVRVDPGPDGGAAQVLSLSLMRSGPQRLTAMITDITAEVISAERERRQAGDRLAVVSEELDQVLAVMSVSVAREDLASGRIAINDRLREWLGLPATVGAIDLATWRALVDPEDLRVFDEDRQRALEGGTTGFRDFRLRGGAGRLGWMAGRRSLSFDADGHPVTLTTFGLDVTEQRAAERERLATAEHLALATTAAGIGSFEFIADDGIWCWSAQTYALHGAIGREGDDPMSLLTAALAPPDRERFESWWRNALAGDGAEALEYAVRLPDGQLRWLNCRGRVRRDGEDRVLSLIGVVWDVTEHRQIEEALQARHVAEKSNRAKTEFLSRMSHEFRTPLNAILGFAELMLMNPGSLSPSQLEQLGHIRAGGRHLLQLVADLLDVSRIETGQLAVTMACVDALGVAQAVLGELKGSLAGRTPRLQLCAPEEGRALVVADATRLRQVLINLISNAVKYNRPDGSVEVWLRREGARWRIGVADTGVGMSDEQLDGLFEPFNRLGRETSRIEGLGIGLVVTRQLVRAMGGDLRVRSQVDAGSQFEFDLAAAAEGGVEPATLPPPAVLPSWAAVQARVLCVEDDPVNRVLLSTSLARYPGLRVEITATGADCIAAAQHSCPDLLLVDQRLPDMSGIDVMQAIRRLCPGPHLPCIIISADALPHEVARALASGADAYIPKPIDFGRLFDEMGRVLRPA